MHQLNLFPESGKIYVVKELSRRMKYTVKDLRSDFPDDDACLEWLVNWLYPNGIICKLCGTVTKHHRVQSRKSYSCDRCGHHVHPMAGTIFHNSHVSLTDWFHAIWLMSANKAGTSAKQLEREIGVSYATAFRMMHKIRTLMNAPDELFSGEIEVDETFVHANTFKRSSAKKRYGWTGQRGGEVIFGMVIRGGPVKVWHVRSAGARVIQPIMQQHIALGSIVHTDGYLPYRKLPRMGYEHRWTEHQKGQYYTPDSSTQNIENVWSHLKRGIKGVYRRVSPKYLQAYANEFAWRYSHRKDVSMFWSLMGRVNK
jgi:transposase